LRSTEKFRRLITRRRTGVSATIVAERGPPSSRLISPKNAPGRRGPGHIDARGSVEDEEELVAGLVRTGKHGAGRGIKDPCDSSDAPELPLAAFLKNPDSLESLDLVPLLDGGPGRNGFQSSLGIVGDRSVHHPADEFHGAPPIRFARAGHVRPPRQHCP
jgi:hypothetical protein